MWTFVTNFCRKRYANSQSNINEVLVADSMLSSPKAVYRGSRPPRKKPSWVQNFHDYQRKQPQVCHRSTTRSNRSASINTAVDSIVGDVKVEMDIRIIFLDVDGTINHLHGDDAVSSICPRCVQTLKLIIQQTSSFIVLSSSWRLNKWHKKTLFRLLREIDVDRGVMIGETRDFSRSDGNRTDEIKDWLDNPQLYKRNCSLRPEEIQNWVSLDDLDLAALETDDEFKSHHIRLDPKLAMCKTDDIVTRVVNKLCDHWISKKTESSPRTPSRPWSASSFLPFKKKGWDHWESGRYLTSVRSMRLPRKFISDRLALERKSVTAIESAHWGTRQFIDIGKIADVLKRQDLQASETDFLTSPSKILGLYSDDSSEVDNKISEPYLPSLPNRSDKCRSCNGAQEAWSERDSTSFSDVRYSQPRRRLERAQSQPDLYRFSSPRDSTNTLPLSSHKPRRDTTCTDTGEISRLSKVGNFPDKLKSVIAPEIEEFETENESSHKLRTKRSHSSLKITHCSPKGSFEEHNAENQKINSPIETEMIRDHFHPCNDSNARSRNQSHTSSSLQYIFDGCKEAVNEGTEESAGKLPPGFSPPLRMNSEINMYTISLLLIDSGDVECETSL